jgi:hypothetical protein
MSGFLPASNMMPRTKIVQLGLLILFCTGLVQAQNNVKIDSLYTELSKIDLSSIINAESFIDDAGDKILRPEFLGYIGDDFQRFRIHFTSFNKSEKDLYTYEVKGKTKVNNNICDFTGTVKVTSAVYNAADISEEINDFRHRYIICEVELYEDKKQNGAGTIRGELTTDVYFNKAGKLCYNALWFGADGFYNNQFRGKWTSYKTGKAKKCNWGDFRIPDSDGLDVGAGEFSVTQKYINNGWQSYYYSYCCDPKIQRTIDARKEEHHAWWK